jgi:hypothetical protein
MYNALLNLYFSSHTKVIAFADDLAIMTKGNSPSETDLFANSDLAKLKKWAKENKTHFSEIKSKAMLITGKRRRNLLLNFSTPCI